MKSSDTFLAPWPPVDQGWRERGLGQALLVTGESAETRLLAEALARQLTCEDAKTPPCSCRSCSRALAEHPDIVVIHPEKNRIRRDQIEPVLQNLYRLPLWSPGQFVWIEQAELMTEAAQNYLLKSLEEPPGYVTFALVTEQSAGLLETVRSRCQVLRAQPGVPQERTLQEFDPRQLFTRDHFTAPGIVDMAYWARDRYRQTGQEGYLSLWEASYQAFRHLEANGNADIAKEILHNIYSHVQR